MTLNPPSLQDIVIPAAPRAPAPAPRRRDLAEYADRYGMTRAVWLHLLREGGRWSSPEIAKFLGVPRERVTITLAQMQRTGSVVRWNKTASPKSRVRFGVTPECNIPQGVTLAEVLALAKVAE